MLGAIFGKFSRDVGIDLGTSHTRVYVKDKGIVIDAPSVVAINKQTGRILAVGEEAKHMLGKTPPHIIVSKPLMGGVISDYEVTQKMLKYFFDKVHEDGFTLFARPRVVVAVPLQITEVETKAVEDVITAAGSGEVSVVQELMAGAIGARMPVEDPVGSLIVDIGGGKSEAATISLGGVVAWRSTEAAGDEMNRNIIQYAREVFNIMIGETHAEQLKKKVGSAIKLDEKIEFPMRGRNVIDGLPKEIMITDSHIREALDRPIKTIINLVKTTVEITPPELVADIHERGILLIGGGSLLRGIDRVIQEATQIPVRIDDDPLTSVVRGTGILLDNTPLLHQVRLPSAMAKRRRPNRSRHTSW
jgi:rod shape-determining protein MreB and related proteins